MPSERTSNPASLRPRWSAFSCLFAWFAGVPTFLPLLVAALGSLDGQHRVSFTEHGGKVAIILGHATGQQSSSHQHSPLAEMIASLSGGDDSSQDHIVTFGNADAVCAAAPRPPQTAAAEVPPPVQHWVSIPLPQTAEASGFAPRPPPTCALALVCLRSITLLV